MSRAELSRTFAIEAAVAATTGADPEKIGVRQRIDDKSENQWGAQFMRWTGRWQRGSVYVTDARLGVGALSHAKARCLQHYSAVAL
jgi:hypothetical protein